MAEDTVGETQLIEYFDRLGFAWERHPEIAGMKPDFAVQVHGDRVIAEVYEPELQLTERAGAFDSVGKLRAAFEGRKRRQKAAAAHAGLPYVLVIGSANSSITYDHFAVTGAMFGRPGATWQIETTTGLPLSEPTFTHLGGARTQPAMNTGVSAVALLRTFNPTLRQLQDAWEEVDPPRTRPRWPDSTVQERVESLARRQAATADLESRGVFDPDASLSRLIIYRNPWAQHPLTMAFGGPHDEHFGMLEVVDGATYYGLVAQGHLRLQVPRSGADDG